MVESNELTAFVLSSNKGIEEVYVLAEEHVSSCLWRILVQMPRVSVSEDEEVPLAETVCNFELCVTALLATA